MGVQVNEDRQGLTTFTFDPASVGANTTVEQTVTIPGLVVGMYVDVMKPTVTAGLGVGNARVSAANTLAITLINSSGGAVDAASETWTLVWYRAEKVVANYVNI